MSACACGGGPSSLLTAPRGLACASGRLQAHMRLQGGAAKRSGDGRRLRHRACRTVGGCSPAHDQKCAIGAGDAGALCWLGAPRKIMRHVVQGPPRSPFSMP